MGRFAAQREHATALRVRLSYGPSARSTRESINSVSAATIAIARAQHAWAVAHRPDLLLNQ